MTHEERNKKIKALLDLLEYSLLMSIEAKAKLVENVDKLTDEQIMAIGKILAIEHYKRDELDQKMGETIKNEVEKLTPSH